MDQWSNGALLLNLAPKKIIDQEKRELKNRLAMSSVGVRAYENIISNDAGSHSSVDARAANRVYRNFVTMAILFSANHGCTVACLALATARLGSLGAWQSGVLYIAYTSSSLLGATYITKQLGSRNAIMTGMGLYCAYVACFLVATEFEEIAKEAALLGAAIGGVGGAFLWTAQGAYFGQAADEHAQCLQQDAKLSTSYLAGVFAFVYLAEEVLLRLLSTALLETGRVSWSVIFGLYTIVAVVSTLGMLLVYNYPNSNERNVQIFYKVTAALQLLKSDPKMKYLIGLNATFGLAGAFLNSYVNGEVVRVALNDPDSKYVGGLSALVAIVAAVASLGLSSVAQRYGKGIILVGGALCFLGVAFPFLLQPNTARWGWIGLIIVYSLQGLGRATFESTLKALFADYFSYEKEGAFANIILQNGLFSAVGYVLSFRLVCKEESRYCVRYSDGSLHNVGLFEGLVVVSAIFAIVGYWQASALYKSEQEYDRCDSTEAELIENESVVSA